MAKSKTGGSRAYIRGRIGSDVYSVGKDGMGKRQQVVRSLAEQVSNPRTQSQMVGRMIMSTVMQAVSAMSAIIDHSFDGFAKGQPSISEFIRRNYALVKADAAAHPASGNAFGINKYQEKGILPGAYVVSNGSAVKPAAVTMSGKTLTIALTSETMTVGGLKAALGITADGYMTAIVVTAESGFCFARVKVDTSLADSTAISSENVASLFSIESNVTAAASVYQSNINIELTVNGNDYTEGVIISDKVDGAWVHSACTLAGTLEDTQAADVALPTYPTGTEQFLNGGDL